MPSNSKHSLIAYEAAVVGALERLGESHTQYARNAVKRGDKSSATLFSREATSYTNALIEYRHGVRPEQLASGAWLLPSRRAGEPPHIVRMDGDWICDCKAGGAMHWPIALIIGIEVAHDDMERMDGGDGEEIEQEPPPPVPITIETTPGGLAFTRRGVTALVTTPADVAGALAQLISGAADARALGLRIARARAAQWAA